MRIKHNNNGCFPEIFVSNAGSGIKKLFRGKLNKDTMQIELVPDGEKNLYAEIQSWKDSVDINKIVDRYRSGEIDILNQVQGTYGDFASAPKDLAEAIAIAENGKQVFARLPVEIKEKFGNNPLLWMKEAGSEKWFDFMQVEQKDVSAAVEKVGESE